MLKNLAIDLGNTNTLIATRDEDGSETLLFRRYLADSSRSECS